MLVSFLTALKVMIAAVDERFATGRSLFYKDLPKLRMLTKLPLAQR
jgi:hypothetical protein